MSVQSMQSAAAVVAPVPAGCRAAVAGAVAARAVAAVVLAEPLALHGVAARGSGVGPCGVVGRVGVHGAGAAARGAAAEALRARGAHARGVVRPLLVAELLVLVVLPPGGQPCAEVHLRPGVAVVAVGLVLVVVFIDDVAKGLGEVIVHGRAVVVLVELLVPRVAVQQRVGGVVEEHHEPIPDAGTAQEEAEEADGEGVGDVAGAGRVLEARNLHQQQVAEQRADDADARGADDGHDLAALPLQNVLLAGRVLADQQERPRRGLDEVLGADDDVVVGVLGEPVAGPGRRPTCSRAGLRVQLAAGGHAAALARGGAPRADTAQAFADRVQGGAALAALPVRGRHRLVFDPVEEPDQAEPRHDRRAEADAAHVVREHCLCALPERQVRHPRLAEPVLLHEVPTDDGEGDLEMPHGIDDLHDPDPAVEVVHDPWRDPPVEGIPRVGPAVELAVDLDAAVVEFAHGDEVHEVVGENPHEHVLHQGLHNGGQHHRPHGHEDLGRGVNQVVDVVEAAGAAQVREGPQDAARDAAHHGRHDDRADGRLEGRHAGEERVQPLVLGEPHGRLQPGRAALQKPDDAEAEEEGAEKEEGVADPQERVDDPLPALLDQEDVGVAHHHREERAQEEHAPRILEAPDGVPRADHRVHGPEGAHDLPLQLRVVRDAEATAQRRRLVARRVRDVLLGLHVVGLDVSKLSA
mmetsp:Transcript_17745/g.46835  ORF Transcript_17745/g.46835 Transcript_17745/m.46835 type:complete len:694 (+) Transcript_17745:411-2492(+)